MPKEDFAPWMGRDETMQRGGGGLGCGTPCSQSRRVKFVQTLRQVLCVKG